MLVLLKKSQTDPDTRVVCQSEGEVHSDDGEAANAGVLPTAGGRGVHPVQTVRTRNPQDHK